MTRPTPAKAEDAGRWRVITLDDAATRNSITAEVQELIAGEFDACSKEGRPMALHGNGPGFSSGANLHELTSLDRQAAYTRSIHAQQLLCSIANSPIQTLALVHSYCIGKGFEMALACEVIAATEDAWFSFPEAAYGFEPGSGGLRLLELRTGHKAAGRIYSHGGRIGAKDALDLGIVNVIFDKSGCELTESYLDLLCAKVGNRRQIGNLLTVDEQFAIKYAEAVTSNEVKERLRHRLVQRQGN